MKFGDDMYKSQMAMFLVPQKSVSLLMEQI